MANTTPHIGQKAVVKGYSMRGKETLEIVTVVEVLAEPKVNPPSPATGHVTIYDCVVESKGIKVFTDSRDFVKCSK